MKKAFKDKFLQGKDDFIWPDSPTIKPQYGEYSNEKGFCPRQGKISFSF